MSETSDYLKYGTLDPEEYNTNNHLYLENFRNKPLYVWTLHDNGDIKKYVANDVEIASVKGSIYSNKGYSERYRWKSEYSNKWVFGESKYLGQFHQNRLITFVDDDEAVLTLIEEYIDQRIKDKYAEFDRSLSIGIDVMRSVTRIRKELYDESNNGH